MMYSSAEAMYCVIAALEAFSYDGEGFFTFRREQNIRKLYLSNECIFQRAAWALEFG